LSPFVDTNTTASALYPAPYGPQHYVSWRERTLHTLTNMVRTRPSAYVNATAFACEVTARPAFRYDRGCHRAAKQQSWLLEQRGCPFQHETCDRFCGLYEGGSCSFASRASTYVTGWTGLGENIQQNSATSLWSVLTTWLRSPGHCRGIFADQPNAMGVGVVAYSYTQVFAILSPLGSVVDGSHVIEGARIRFLTSASTGATLLYNNTRHAFPSSSRSLYFPVPRGGCERYALMIGGARLPAVGWFLTQGAGSCVTNYVSQ
jgi:hypothetical protein